MIDRYRAPARSRTTATSPLTTEATTDTAEPDARRSRAAAGSGTAGSTLNRITAAATKIIIPSAAAEKYSALLCPKWWFLSAGLIATVSATRATIAATRLTSDSAASDSRPTDPVICHATVFRAIVTSAAAMDSHANRLRSTGCGRARAAGMVTRPFSYRPEPRVTSPEVTVVMPWMPGRPPLARARVIPPTARNPTSRPGERLGVTTEGVIR